MLKACYIVTYGAIWKTLSLFNPGERVHSKVVFSMGHTGKNKPFVLRGMERANSAFLVSEGVQKPFPV